MAIISNTLHLLVNCGAVQLHIFILYSLYKVKLPSTRSSSRLQGSVTDLQFESEVISVVESSRESIRGNCKLLTMRMKRMKRFHHFGIMCKWSSREREVASVVLECKRLRPSPEPLWNHFNVARRLTSIYTGWKLTRRCNNTVLLNHRVKIHALPQFQSVRSQSQILVRNQRIHAVTVDLQEVELQHYSSGSSSSSSSSGWCSSQSNQSAYVQGRRTSLTQGRQY